MHEFCTSFCWNFYTVAFKTKTAVVKVGQCLSKDAEPTCVNFKQIKKPHGHRSMDQACPVYQVELKKLEKRIDL